MPLMAYLADAGDPAQLLPAREQMAFTLGFHIILVPFGVAFTFLMLVANYRGLRRHDDTALLLAERWSRVAAVLFAVGAVSGTVLSFELGLLWPGLMGRYGAAYGLPFGVEGIFFFIEAISSRSTFTGGAGSAPGRTSGRVCRSRWPVWAGRCRWSPRTDG
jgi:cytochrome d ubiquinol oxidase subunit I